MAYALGFPKDVTDAIMGMRDWRWEMVRDGGKTPSASCVNICPLYDLYREPMTHRMDTDKEYIAIIACQSFIFVGIGVFRIQSYTLTPKVNGGVSRLQPQSHS